MAQFNNIDASIFEDAHIYYEIEFLSILSKIVTCYQKILSQHQKMDNDEDKIRDYLHLNYLNNPVIRSELKLFYHFECEPKEFGIKEGYLDIKIFNENIFSNPSEYFIIECKRLNNKSKRTKDGLNGKYIKNGIVRFVEKKYSSYHRINGMFGFIVEKLNINKNIDDINYLLLTFFPEANTSKKLLIADIIESFPFLYTSEHLDSDGDKFKLYHVMFDLSDSVN